MRRATPPDRGRHHERRVSIRARRAARDATPTRAGARAASFNPRAPCGARPVTDTPSGSILGFQSARAVRRATALGWDGGLGFDVSIRARRAARDPFASGFRAGNAGFNPRAPCGARHRPRPRCPQICCFNPRAPCGARHSDGAKCVASRPFQSARAVRRATFFTQDLEDIREFNPRAPCGARPTPSAVTVSR